MGGRGGMQGTARDVMTCLGRPLLIRARPQHAAPHDGEGTPPQLAARGEVVSPGGWVGGWVGGGLNVFVRAGPRVTSPLQHPKAIVRSAPNPLHAPTRPSKEIGTTKQPRSTTCRTPGAHDFDHPRHMHLHTPVIIGYRHRQSVVTFGSRPAAGPGGSAPSAASWRRRRPWPWEAPCALLTVAGACGAGWGEWDSKS